MDKLVKMPTKDRLFEDVLTILKNSNDVLIRCYPDGNVIIYEDTKKAIYNGKKD